MRAANAVIQAVKMEGVKFIAGVPGGSVHELVDALYDDREVRAVLVRHERVGVDMADGYARVSGRPGVALAVQGPGAANAVGGIANAYADSAPVLLLQGQVRQNLLGKQVVQEMDLMKLYQATTKWLSSINHIERVPEIMRRAFVQLLSGRPRPVVVEIPNDVLAAEGDDEMLRYTPVLKRIRSNGDPADIERAAEMLLTAKNPFILAGAGIFPSGASVELRTLADLLTVPVGTTLMGKSAFPENHPLSVGISGYPRALFATKQALRMTDKADVVLAIGCSFKPPTYVGMTVGKTPAPHEVIPKGVKIIQIDVDPSEIGKNFPVDLAILGDAKLVLTDLIQAIRDRADQSRLAQKDSVIEEIKGLKQKWMEEWMPVLTSDEVPINPYRLTWEVMNAVDRNNTIILHDSGSGRGYLAHVYESSFPRSFLGFGGQSAMGWSLGAAMGAKLAAPDRVVVDMIGDGSFGMTGMDLETAVRCEIPILVVVVNNYLLNLSAETRRQKFQERYLMVELTGNYTRVAEGLGAHAERVQKPGEIRPALERAVRVTREGKPALVEVMTKRLEPLPKGGTYVSRAASTRLRPMDIG